MDQRYDQVDQQGHKEQHPPHEFEGEGLNLTALHAAYEKAKNDPRIAEAVKARKNRWNGRRRPAQKRDRRSGRESFSWGQETAGSRYPSGIDSQIQM